MPKIPALPPMTSPDGADQLPIEDASTGNTKYISLTRLKEWLQSFTAWVSKSNIDFNSGVWWEEIGRTELSVAADTIGVSFAARKHLKIIIFYKAQSGTVDGILRYNNDSGSNYRYTSFSGSDSGNQTSTPLDSGIPASGSVVNVDIEMRNTAGEIKYGTLTGRSGTSGNAVTTFPIFPAYFGTSQITSLSVINSGAGDFAPGSYVIVLGHD